MQLKRVMLNESGKFLFSFVESDLRHVLRRMITSRKARKTPVVKMLHFKKLLLRESCLKT